MKKQILIRLSEDVLKTLDSYCKAHGIVRGQYITQAVIKSLNKDISKSEVQKTNNKTVKKS